MYVLKKKKNLKIPFKNVCASNITGRHKFEVLRNLTSFVSLNVERILLYPEY